jgi:hypothetical protein
VREAKAAYHLVFPGLLHLPFEHDDIRVYIDGLFLEGMLHPVPHAQAYSLAGTWAGIGIHTDSEADRLHLKGLMDSIEATISSEDARHGDWLHFAYRWAELIVLTMGSEIGPSGDIQDRLEGLRTQLDLRFTTWVQRRYGSLINLPPVPPVMLHHVPRYLAHRLGESQQERIVFLLVDGLALDQWVALREVLISQRPRLHFRESAIFAWVPTLTAVSRQAAFAGKPPIYFPSSIHTTEKESALWKQFWVDQGLAQHEVAYMKGLGDGSLNQVNEGLSHSMIHVLGLVIDKVDRTMHGMELGTAGMHNQVRQWARQGFLAGFLDLLIDRGFSIYLASDHGNIEAKGCGQPAEGAVADLRGERMRVYPDTLLRAGVKKRFPEAIEWPPLGLPENYLPLLAPPPPCLCSRG